MGFGRDTLIFSDVAVSEVQLRNEDGNLVIDGYHEDDQVVIERFFKGDSRRIAAFTFSDQTLSVSDLNNLMATQSKSLNAGYEQLIHAMSTFGSGSSAMDLIDDRSLYAPELLAGINPS